MGATELSALVNSTDRAVWFFEDVVTPTCQEFLSDPADRRKGMLACIVLSSMADHHFHGSDLNKSSLSPAELRKHLGADNWAYRQVCDLANAVKHFRRKPGKVGIEATHTRTIDVSNLRAGWPINGQLVVVDTQDHGDWALFQLVEASLEMWTNLLAS